MNVVNGPFPIALLFAACLLLPQAALAQTALASSPQFEVASIKPTQPSNIPRAPMRVDPARVAYNSASPKMLIQIAYRVPEWGLLGGPSWLDSDRYDIAATLPPGTSPDRIPLMLQALLAERFRLEVRRETRQMSVYALTVAKNGPKLKPGDTGEQWIEGSMKGGIFAGRIELHRITLAGLAEVLATKTGRPVIDMTKLLGEFDIRLEWKPDDLTGNGSSVDGPSLYTALGEQLGLKLEPTRAAVEVLVISRMEKPSGN